MPWHHADVFHNWPAPVENLKNMPAQGASGTPALVCGGSCQYLRMK